MRYLLYSVLVFFFASVSNSGQVVPKLIISSKYEEVSGRNSRFYSEAVGAGRAAEGLRADWQRDLATVHRECGFKYVRFHGLLHDEMGVYGDDRFGNPVYNFQYIDTLYDSILRIGVRPFVELAFMPDKLKSSDKTVFWWKGNISPPKDHDKWRKKLNITFMKKRCMLRGRYDTLLDTQAKFFRNGNLRPPTRSVFLSYR